MASGEFDRSHDTSPKPRDSIEPTAAIEEADAPLTPIKSGNETPKMPHDSMVTVRLSEPPSLTLDTTFGNGETPKAEARFSEAIGTGVGNHQRHSSPTATTPASSRISSLSLENADTKSRSLQAELEEDANSREDDQISDDQDDVNWERLERSEDEQTKDEETDNSTALLLARLEQENAKLATNPKSVQAQKTKTGSSNTTRPPSMAQLREMVNKPAPSALRYSMVPVPQMTDLDFWGAVVKDYQQTAARLPTLLAHKIHKGIPHPLRGVVWQSMSGARDSVLEEQYERYSGESSPYEFLIGKDLGRSFPGVDMFRDPEGDGQRMLGRVLKAFSLYDTKIGYCQGLAFLVGPLLMRMPDKQAFCVLVKLMERYDLRTCFLPDLSGLHVRIYQFRELLRKTLPALSAHLEELQVDPAYVSQWFLSFFAVTCPQHMLFRIYDVVFAEGASETLMRVALSLMRKNETRLLACMELEDVMQLLLSRSLWDCYHYDADELVTDFVSLTGEVSKENLSQLEQGYRESLIAAASVTRASDITTAATRFLGRIWATSTNLSTKPATLAPATGGQSRPLSMLQRSASKQSMASFLTLEASSASVASSASTEATTVSRDSSQPEEESASRESTPVGTKSVMSTKTIDDRYLHSQIEDLLTALSELQRNHTVLSNQLQLEKEEREEDQKAIRPLLQKLKESNTLDVTISVPDDLEGQANRDDEGSESKEPSEPDLADMTIEKDTGNQGSISVTLSELVERAEERFGNDDKKRRSSIMQTKMQLREELTQVKDRLASAMSQTQNFDRRIHELTQEVSVTKEQLRESHTHVRTLHQEKNRLEKLVQGMRSRTVSANGDMNKGDHDLDHTTKGGAGGLREFKLGRSKSTPSQGGFIKRLSSLPAPGGHESAIAGSEDTSSLNETEALLVELAQSKTAEAVAKQEAEESKQKLEALRKAYGLATGDASSVSNQPSNAATAAIGVFGRLTGQGATPPAEANNAKLMSSSSGTATNSGSFWGWRR